MTEFWVSLGCLYDQWRHKMSSIWKILNSEVITSYHAFKRYNHSKLEV